MKIPPRKSLIVFLSVAATFALLIVLGWSLRPDPPPRGALPTVNIAALAPRSMMTLDTDSLRYFIVKSAESRIHVVAAPIANGKLLMPEGHWWKPLIQCKRFGLDAADGAITDQSRFRCHDDNQPAEWAQRWQWDLFGRAIRSTDSKLDDMYRVRVARDGDTLTFVSLEMD